MELCKLKGSGRMTPVHSALRNLIICDAPLHVITALHRTKLAAASMWFVECPSILISAIVWSSEICHMCLAAPDLLYRADGRFRYCGGTRNASSGMRSEKRLNGRPRRVNVVASLCTMSACFLLGYCTMLPRSSSSVLRKTKGMPGAILTCRDGLLRVMGSSPKVGAKIWRAPRNSSHTPLLILCCEHLQDHFWLQRLVSGQNTDCGRVAVILLSSARRSSVKESLNFGTYLAM